MNHKRTFRSALCSAILFAFLIPAACLFLAPAPALAADQPTAVANATLETAASVAQPFIVSFAQSHPWLLTVLAVVATLRLVFKPITSVVEAYVKSTASTKDDEVVANIEHSAAYKVVAWLIDYLGSIKVGPQATPAPAPAPTPTPPPEAPAA